MSAVEIEVERYLKNPWSFFWEMDDVDDLGPGEEKARALAARIDGEIVGMAVYEVAVGRPYIMRVAVVEEWRREGVATALIERLQEMRDDWYCYIDRGNLPSMELVSNLGFRRGGYRPGRNLYQWSWAGGE